MPNFFVQFDCLEDPAFLESVARNVGNRAWNSKCAALLCRSNKRFRASVEERLRDSDVRLAAASVDDATLRRRWLRLFLSPVKDVIEAHPHISVHVVSVCIPVVYIFPFQNKCLLSD